MATSGAVRDHAFHPVVVERVVAETSDASSFVLGIPPELEAGFAYEAGQFCTFRVAIDGVHQLRCYSMSSSPDVDDQLQVTVKRVPGGLVSNWLLDTVREGDVVDVTYPAGVFRLPPGDAEVVAFAAGSGITPVLSILKSALATTSRRVRLLYANRDRDSVIFEAELGGLAACHEDRLAIEHHLDVERGFVDAEAVRAFGIDPGAEHLLCGPAPFMDVVERALLDRGVGSERIHVERFTPASLVEADGGVGTGGSAAAAGEPATTQVTIELDGRTASTEHRPGTTILQTARQLGMSPPFSCESGSCATCMARCVEGSVRMHVNNALTDDEVADGWVLTCQAVPTSATVRVHYGYEEA